MVMISMLENFSKESFTITEMKPIKKRTNGNGPVSLLLKMKRKQKLEKQLKLKVKKLSHYLSFLDPLPLGSIYLGEVIMSITSNMIFNCSRK